MVGGLVWAEGAGLAVLVWAEGVGLQKGLHKGTEVNAVRSHSTC